MDLILEVPEKIRMSSMYTNTNKFGKISKNIIHKGLEAAGVFVRLKGITRY